MTVYLTNGSSVDIMYNSRFELKDEFEIFAEEVKNLNDVSKYNIKFIDKEGHIEYYSLVE